jgi:hypothetical protein
MTYRSDSTDKHFEGLLWACLKFGIFGKQLFLTDANLPVQVIKINTESRFFAALSFLLKKVQDEYKNALINW